MVQTPRRITLAALLVTATFSGRAVAQEPVYATKTQFRIPFKIDPIERDRLGIYESSAIVLTSDHGEGLGDHGEAEHGLLVYREALQVPLILKLPASSRRGTRVAVPAQLNDLFPTILRLAGNDAQFVDACTAEARWVSRQIVACYP